MDDVTYFKMEIEGVTRQRAEAVGMNYEAILFADKTRITNQCEQTTCPPVCVGGQN